MRPPSPGRPPAWPCPVVFGEARRVVLGAVHAVVVGEAPVASRGKRSAPSVTTPIAALATVAALGRAAGGHRCLPFGRRDRDGFGSGERA